MARLSAALVVVALALCALGASGKSRVTQSGDTEQMDWNEFLQFVCTNDFTVFPSYLCNPYTTTIAPSSGTPTTPGGTPTTPGGTPATPGGTPATPGGTPATPTTSSTASVAPSTTTTSGSPLEHALWCQFSNGSSLALGQTFLYTDCALCQCTQSRAIRCATFQCMATYCADGSTPVKRAGQCCQQCAYENSSASCVFNGLTVPTGTLLRQTTDGIQCWCELGTVECRKSSASSADYFGDGTTVYILVIVIIVILIGGTLLCCIGGLAFYYYYYNANQQTVQDAYAQYYGNAGWQPMNEDGQVVVDGVTPEKQVEAEQQQYQQQYPTGQSEGYVPPPYAIFNGTNRTQ